jgi:hypothetical protein
MCINWNRGYAGRALRLKTDGLHPDGLARNQVIWQVAIIGTARRSKWLVVSRCMPRVAKQILLISGRVA